MKDEYGKTALIHLCENNLSVTPELIRELKNEIGLKDDEGKVALVYLYKYNRSIFPKLYLELKDEINIKSLDMIIY